MPGIQWTYTLSPGPYSHLVRHAWDTVDLYSIPGPYSHLVRHVWDTVVLYSIPGPL